VNAAQELPVTVLGQQSLWEVVWKLMHLRLVILVSGFRRAKLRNKIMMIILWLLLLGFLGFIFFLSFLALHFLNSPELTLYIGDVSPWLEVVPALIFSGAFLGLLLTSFGVLLQALYLAGDMEFLLAAPIPIRAVFTAKLLQAILPNFGLVCLFALPVLYGLGASNRYNFLYYPLVLILLTALALAATGISSLLVMVVVRIFPARRVAEVLGFLGAILSFLCSQTGQLANINHFSPNQASQALGLVKMVNTSWSPLAWAGRGLVNVGKGNWLEGGGLVLVTVILASLVFGAALVTSERLFYSGWASLQNKSRKKKAPRTAQTRAQTYIIPVAERRTPGTIRAIMMKDWLVLRRDLRNMSQLVTPLILGVVYAFMLLRNGGGRADGLGDAPAWMAGMLKNLSLYFSVGLALFVGWMLLGRLAGMGFSQEGKNYWLLKSAPVSIGRLVAAKYLVAYLPTALLSGVFLLATWMIQRAPISTLLYSLPVIGLCIAGNAGINLTFGITGANLAWEDPRQMQKSASGCLGALASFIYLPVSLLLFFGPPVAAMAFELPEIIGQMVGLVLGGVFSLACAVVPLWLVSGRVARLGEK